MSTSHNFPAGTRVGVKFSTFDEKQYGVITDESCCLALMFDPDSGQRIDFQQCLGGVPSENIERVITREAYVPVVGDYVRVTDLEPKRWIGVTGHVTTTAEYNDSDFYVKPDDTPENRETLAKPDGDDEARFWIEDSENGLYVSGALKIEERAEELPEWEKELIAVNTDGINQAEIDRLKAALATANQTIASHEEWRKEFKTAADEFANGEDWCDEYDRFMAKFGFEPRTKNYRVTTTITVTAEYNGVEDDRDAQMDALIEALYQMTRTDIGDAISSNDCFDVEEVEEY